MVTVEGETEFMGLLVPASIAKEDTEKNIAGKLGWILAACDPLAVIAFGSAARREIADRTYARPPSSSRVRRYEEASLEWGMKETREAQALGESSVAWARGVTRKA